MSDNFSLTDKNNFYENFDNDVNYYFSTYYTILNKFITYISKNIIVQNEEYYKYILKKGIELIGHIYKFLLMYTKNLDLTIHHTQKGYYYYVEFVGQISNEHNSFLNLNLKDAILFVYRKTIFNIDEDFKKKYELNNEDKTNLLYLNNRISCIEMYYNILLQYFTNGQDNEFNITTTQKIVELILNSFSSDFINIIGIQNKIFKKLIFLCYENSINIHKCEQIIQKLVHKKIDLNSVTILNNLMQHSINEKIRLLTPLKFVNTIISQK